MAAKNISVANICRTLNAEGVPTANESAYKKRGPRGWGKNTVSNIIRDPSYYGEPMGWGKTRLAGRYANGVAKREFTGDPHHVGPATPPIVDKALWEAAQGTIDFHRTHSNVVHRKKKFRMLAGMIKCGCGETPYPQAVYGWKGEQKSYDYYVCMSGRKGARCGAPMMQVGKIEQEVWGRGHETC
jgi:hypothetical protein